MLLNIVQYGWTLYQSIFMTIFSSSFNVTSLLLLAETLITVIFVTVAGIESRTNFPSESATAPTDLFVIGLKKVINDPPTGFMSAALTTFPAIFLYLIMDLSLINSLRFRETELQLIMHDVKIKLSSAKINNRDFIGLKG